MRRLILRATDNAIWPQSLPRVGTGFMLPSARLAIGINPKVVDQRTRRFAGLLHFGANDSIPMQRPFDG